MQFLEFVVQVPVMRGFGVSAIFKMVLIHSCVVVVGCGQMPIGIRLGYDNKDVIASSPIETQSMEQISFQTVNEKVLKQNCQTCHASRPPILVSYEDYKSNLAAVEKHALIIKDMPQSGPLSQDDQRLLKRWIDQGAPLEGAPFTREPELSPKPQEPVYWSEVNAKIFVKSCNACHYPGNKLGEDGDSLSLFQTLEEVQSTMGTIYYASVIASVMPPIQKGAKDGDINLNQLSLEQKELLSRWIIQGMKADPVP